MWTVLGGKRNYADCTANDAILGEAKVSGKVKIAGKSC